MYGLFYRHVLLPFFDGVVKQRKTLSYWASANQSQWLSRAELEARQSNDVAALLTHAVAHCPYYTQLAREHQLAGTIADGTAGLQTWPLLTKSLIRQHRSELRSRLDDRLMTKATGGSSGEPLHFDLNSDSNDRRTAMMYRGYEWAGAQPGTKQLFVWGVALGSVPYWKRMKANLHHAIDRHAVISCFDFTPTAMPRHVARMNRYRCDVIVAYTNPLYELARYIDSAGVKVWSPKSIVVGAEKLHEFQRTLIEKVFQAPVFETYGSREFMLIGAECERHTGLHLSMDNLLVEVLNDDGTPTEDGEEGNVVVTDLFNYGMPFIRYVNGDRAVAGFTDCPCGRGLPLLRKVTGRQLDVLETPDGRKVPGEFFPHLIKEFPNIRRFQVVQTVRDTITLKLVADGGLTLSDREALIAAIRQPAGHVVKIDLQFVNDIPLTAAGKHRVVVNLLGHPIAGTVGSVAPLGDGPAVPNSPPAGSTLAQGVR